MTGGVDDNLLADDNLALIDSNSNIDIKAKSNTDKEMTGNNLHKVNFEINIKDLFQYV